jgi:ATP-dependent Lhr-like helicase
MASMALRGFHPTVASWFAREIGEPTAPQQRGWPQIQAGRHVLIAAPTGSGKTLAAFLAALDALLREGAALPDETRVVYVSPLKALSNDVQKNLLAPLARLRELDPTLPEVRVMVRTGDTPAAERTAMARRPPHVLVTTPESLYILLTSESGRAMLSKARVAIVDEIHAILGDKRAAHLALSLERLSALAGEVQRIGLSATQKPIEDVGRFLGGAGREVELVDEGHLRRMDLALEIPPSPLETVCSMETASEIHKRIADLSSRARTTLVFVTTRKMAERTSVALAKLLGEGQVGCHHSSLSRERRLDAEQRLKRGELKLLVATASLELGIDIGDVDLVVQLGVPRSIAALLQRVGRSGHGVGRTPVGVLFPLTRDELVEAAALLAAIRRGILDRTPQPRAPLDVLAQQIVAECAGQSWNEQELFERLRRAWPYRELERKAFDAAIGLHTQGRAALLHRDGVRGILRGTRRARLTAITCGGAIPDSTQYRVLAEPEGVFVGSVDEDFAIESSTGDVFQLGATSWRVLKIEAGALRVADAHGSPPSLPFWFGEAPSRTAELSQELSRVRENGRDRAWLERECGLDAAAADELARYLEEGFAALGAMPTAKCVVLERFFDDSGGMQLILHAPFGGRINRAFGLALRKRFCRHFGFELQAAANEDAITLSLGPQHSFELDSVVRFLHEDTAQDVLRQALLASPLFESRWRWNAARSLCVERFQSGKRTPAPLLRMRADDLLAAAFPNVVACGENLPPGDLDIPDDHPLVAQTLDDCLHHTLDAEGFVELVRGLRTGSIAHVAVDVASPSPFARSVLAVRPYGFLDDAPLEERRTQAVRQRRSLDPARTAELGQLDPAAVARVREEAWPDPRNEEELHEALLWMGYVAQDEVRDWGAWLAQLAAQGRVAFDDERWFAVEASREPLDVLRGRLEALGPIHDDQRDADEGLLRALEAQGRVLRVHFEGRGGWCDRRLLARIQSYTLDALRRAIAPVSPARFERFLAAWQHVAPQTQLEGPAGVLEVVRQLAGVEAPLSAWEKHIFPARVAKYRAEWLDQLGAAGRVSWRRLWGAGRSALRSTPIAFFPRDQSPLWSSLAARDLSFEPSWPARAAQQHLVERGASFLDDLVRATHMLPADVERGLGELVALGLVTADSFASVRHLLRPAHRRRDTEFASGRWSALDAPPPSTPGDVEELARVLLRRYGVVFRAVLERERIPTPWREVARALRLMELRGDVRGGRFVTRFSGEQFALPEAVSALRRSTDEEQVLPQLHKSDPLATTIVGLAAWSSALATPRP